MSGIAGGPRPPQVDYTAIETRIRREKVDDNRSRLPELEQRHEAALRKYEEHTDAWEAASSRDTFFAALKVNGILAAVGGGIGGLVGYHYASGGSMARLGKGAISAMAGAMALPFAGYVLYGLSGAGRSPGDAGNASRPVPPALVAATDSYHAATVELRDTKADIEAYSRITPGAAWMLTPVGNGTTPLLSDYVRAIFTAHDHDASGEIRITDPQAMTPDNEFVRNPEGGPVANARERALDMERAYRLDLARLERYDADSSGTISPSELAEGMVLDSGKGWGGLYWNARD